MDISYALKTYLGADANGGYEPFRCDERLKQTFPQEFAQILRLLAPYLEADHVPDWSKYDLVQERDRFVATLEQLFPELDAIAVKALSNRWAFGWK